MVAAFSAVPGIASSAKGDVITFVVDMMPVEHMLNELSSAISGPSLAAFLQGPGMEFFHTDIESRFYEEGDVKSGFWAPLTETTRQIRESLGFTPDDINRRTDEMFDFLMHTYPVSFGVGYAHMSVPGDAPTPMLKKKLKTAQQGSDNNPRGFGPTPARPVLAVSELDATTLAELLAVAVLARLMSGTL